MTAKSPKEGGLCWNCRKPAEMEDNYCRFCGKDLVSFPWFYRHWGIILLTVAALGPFSLILVWRSPVLSRTAQWIYTLLLLILTYQFLVGCYHLWLFVNSAINAALHGALPVGF